MVPLLFWRGGKQDPSLRMSRSRADVQQQAVARRKRKNRAANKRARAARRANR